VTVSPGAAVILTVVVPVAVAVAGLLVGGRSLPWAREWAVLGAGVTLAAAVAEAVLVAGRGPVQGIPFLGTPDLGSATVGLTVRGDSLSASVAVAVAVVALCVQVYSTAYLRDPAQPDGTPAAGPPVEQAVHHGAPTRYPAYASTVSLFTAAMMLVVHADDLLLLLVGWEVMGLCSYLLVGHHSERPAARAAAVKAFLVTRVGDLGVLLAVVVLLASAGTTSVTELTDRASGRGEPLDGAAVTLAALLLLAGVAGKSAQFPLHTWLPDAMEGPTPVSALIHAATMVAAGVYLVARLMPLFLVADGALAVAAVIASITMLGAALAALAQDDVKRLLAWSTISQVAYMLGGVAVAAGAVSAAQGSAPGVFHLLSHAAFKALLFLVAGCLAHLVGSTLFASLGGLRRTHPWLLGLWGLGLAALAGLPPLGGFWSKEAVLTAAEQAAAAGVGWPAQMVLASGLLTTLVTGAYAGRAFALVSWDRAGPTDPADAATPGPATPGPAATPAAAATPGHARLPAAMVWPLWVLAVPTALLGLVLLRPPAVLEGVHVNVFTAFTATLLSLAGVGWALSAPRLGARDVADALPVPVRAFLRDGYRLDGVQHALVVRPYRALARVASAGDRDVVDAYVRAAPLTARWAGLVLRRTQTGLATAYLAWLVIGAVLAGVVGVVGVVLT